MIFLIEYDRKAGRKLTYEQFSDQDRAIAQAKRREIELEHARNGGNCEVVLLEAESEAVIRRTHSRYFESLEQLLDAADKSMSDARAPDA
jgi:hypothetical protein